MPVIPQEFLEDMTFRGSVQKSPVFSSLEEKLQKR